MAKAKTAAVLSEEDAAAIEVLKERLRQTADRLCAEDGQCNTARSVIYAASALGLGSSGREDYHTIDGITVTVDGITVATSQITYRGFSKDDALKRYLKDLGHKFPPVEYGPDLDPTNDSDAVKAYKALIHDLAVRARKDYGMQRRIFNKYLKWMGVAPLPGPYRYVYEVKLAKPVVIDVFQYYGSGNTEEEARVRAMESFQRDLDRRAASPAYSLSNGYPAVSGQSAYVTDPSSAARLAPLVEGATLTLDTTIEPVATD